MCKEYIVQEDGNVNYLPVDASTTSEERVKNFLKNPSEECKGYYCITMSPAVDAGLDINPEEPHFNTLFAYFNNQTVQPGTAAQMLHRVRDLKPIDNIKRVVLCIDEQNNMAAYPPGSPLLSENSMRGWIFKRQMDHTDGDVVQRLRNTTLEEILYDRRLAEDPQTGHWVMLPYNGMWADIFAQNVVKEHRGRLYFRETLLQLLQSNGGIVQPLMREATREEDMEIKRMTKLFNRQAKEQHLAELSNPQNIVYGDTVNRWEREHARLTDAQRAGKQIYNDAWFWGLHVEEYIRRVAEYSKLDKQKHYELEITCHPQAMAVAQALDRRKQQLKVSLREALVQGLETAPKEPKLEIYETNSYERTVDFNLRALQHIFGQLHDVPDIQPFLPPPDEDEQQVITNMLLERFNERRDQGSEKRCGKPTRKNLAKAVGLPFCKHRDQYYVDWPVFEERRARRKTRMQNFNLMDDLDIPERMPYFKPMQELRITEIQTPGQCTVEQWVRGLKHANVGRTLSIAELFEMFQRSSCVEKPTVRSGRSLGMKIKRFAPEIERGKRTINGRETRVYLF